MSDSTVVAARPASGSRVKVRDCEDLRAAGFALGRQLGEGRFSQVVHGTQIATGAQFALKVIEQASLLEDEEAAAALRMEVEVLARAADHPNVVRLHSVVRTPAATYLVMELLHGGELFDAIIARGSFPEAEVRAQLLLTPHAHACGSI